MISVMQRRLKERLIGAAVLVMLAVIFIPMLLDNSGQFDSEITGSNIPDRPEGEFTSRIVSLDNVKSDTHEADSPTPPIPVKQAPAVNAITKVPFEENPGQPSMQDQILKPNVEKPNPPQVVLPREEFGVTAWVVQLGSFANEENANKLNEKLRKQGFTAFVEPVKRKSKIRYRVRVGPELLRSDAEALQKKLKEKVELDSLVIKYP